MNNRTRFWQAFLGSSGPTWELIGAFALGVLMVGIVSNFFYDLLVFADRWWWDVILVAGTAVVLTGIAYLLFWLDRRKERAVNVDVDESRLAPPHSGLIWLFGPGRFDHLIFALKHHAKDGGALHCWLVMQGTPKVQEAYTQFSQALLEAGLSTKPHPVYIPSLDAQAAYQVVREIFDREAQEEGVEPESVIADITGGTKPLTAGMVLATITANRQMEYVESDRNAQGDPIPDTLRVVLIDADFTIAEQE